MKRLLTITFGILLTGLTVAQNVEQRELPFFDKIKVSGQIKVFIEKGDKELATIKANEILTSDIIVEVVGKTLEIKLKKDS